MTTSAWQTSCELPRRSWQYKLCAIALSGSGRERLSTPILKLPLWKFPMDAVLVYGVLVTLFILICIPFIKMTNDATERHKQWLRQRRQDVA